MLGICTGMGRAVRRHSYLKLETEKNKAGVQKSQFISILADGLSDASTEQKTVFMPH